MKTGANIKEDIGDIIFSYYNNRDFSVFKKEITSYVESFKEAVSDNELYAFILTGLLKECNEMDNSNIKTTVGGIVRTLTTLSETE